jgi:hypothetical protein
MKLTTIVFTPKNITKGIAPIRQMKSLKTIATGLADKDQFPPAEFWKKYDAGEFNKPTSAAVPADRKPITTFNAPAFQRWMKEVAALPAEKQVEAVAKKLQELNPGFDGKVTGGYAQGTPNIENGVVTGFGFRTDNVTDISPVRALQRLRALYCGGTDRNNCKFSDLSPLKGMPLTNLSCGLTQVSDLSPLTGMLLTSLDCGKTRVCDLPPLKGMPLTQLYCAYTRVADLSALRGMPLRILDCGGLKVSDLSPLKGMKLDTLGLSGTPVSNLSPLEGMPLSRLCLDYARVSDLSPLQGMPLNRLDCNDTPVSDLSPVGEMHLTLLNFTPKNITKGLDVIRQMKTLKTIGTSCEGKDQFPSAEFWKKYDAGEFNK